MDWDINIIKRISFCIDNYLDNAYPCSDRDWIHYEVKDEQTYEDFYFVIKSLSLQ